MFIALLGNKLSEEIVPKDLLISKGLFGILNSSKKEQKQFDSKYHSIYTYFRLFFKRIEGTKKSF